jgi:hypothetical protein
VDCEIVFYLSRKQDIYHASSIYTGLCRLSARGMVRLKFVVSRGSSNSYEDSAHTVMMRVKFGKSGESLLIAIDLSDHSSILTARALESCDVYLKRSFYRPDISWLSADLRRKVFPFGLNYACKSSASVLVVLLTLGPEFLRRPWPGRKVMQTYLGGLKPFLTSADVKEFEYDPEQKAEPTITFQTRVWPPDEVSGSVQDINENRVALVRALKRAFGIRFQGGLVPTAYARKHYPHDLAQRSSKQSQYVTWSKKNLIGVNTRGLHHSVAFKLAEYYAASKCVVSCPIRNELPVPLVEGQHYLPFTTIEQCINHCDNLLREPNLAMKLRKEAWEYYRNEIEPAAHLRNSLMRIAELYQSGLTHQYCAEKQDRARCVCALGEETK